MSYVSPSLTHGRIFSPPHPPRVRGWRRMTFQIILWGTITRSELRYKTFELNISIAFLFSVCGESQMSANPWWDHLLSYQWPHWQDVGRVTKFAWSIVQLLMVAISCFVYIPLRLLRKSPCFDEGDGCWWNFREIYEHPFSKFINHSTWYMVFLVFVFLNSMQHSFATRLVGLEWIGMSLYFYFLIGNA